MTLQQWAFSFKGRIGRKAFWVGITACFIIMVLMTVLQKALNLPHLLVGMLCVLLLYPLAAIFTKRFHDRGKSGKWFGLILLAFALFSLDISLFTPLWQWGIGRFLPLFIITMLVIDCGGFKGMLQGNCYGQSTENVDYLS